MNYFKIKFDTTILPTDATVVNTEIVQNIVYYFCTAYFFEKLGIRKNMQYKRKNIVECQRGTTDENK